MLVCLATEIPTYQRTRTYYVDDKSLPEYVCVPSFSHNNAASLDEISRYLETTHWDAPSFLIMSVRCSPPEAVSFLSCAGAIGPHSRPSCMKKNWFAMQNLGVNEVEKTVGAFAFSD